MVVARTPQRTASRRRRSNPVPALLGCLVCVAAIVYGGVTISRFHAARERTSTWYNRELEAIRQEGAQRKERIEKERADVVTQLRAAQTRGKALRQKTLSLTGETELQRAKLAELEGQMKSLEGKLTDQRSDRELLSEGVGELQDRAARLRQEKEALLEQYKAAYLPMKSSLRALVDGGNPDRIKQFFMTNRSTPLGPAAAFYAADAYFAQGKTMPASKLYQDLIDQFPECGYVGLAKDRLQSIQTGYAYDKGKVALKVYGIPESLDLGDW